MIKKLRTNEGITYEKLSPEEMKARGILGRLIGPCADFNKATRNGRKYTEQLWENVFSNPIMQEKIKNGVCFGELGHPEDRTEIDMEKIAVCLREQPVKNDKGQLCAVFDILDTPNGRILKTLCDYGSTVGVSSRGQGDLITDSDGNEMVDPDTYECECWDIVLVPAVESARMQYVTEDLNTTRVKLRKALTESLNKATEEDKKIMESTLEELKINLSEDTPADDIDQEEYKKEGLAFAERIRNEFDAERAKEVFYNEYEFDKHAPDDEVEQAIFDALKAKMEEVQESLNEEAEEEPVEDNIQSEAEEQPEEPTADANAEANAQPDTEETPNVVFTDEEVKEVAKEAAEAVAEEAGTEVEPETVEEKVEEVVSAAVEEKVEEATEEVAVEAPEEEPKEELPEEQPTEEAEEIPAEEVAEEEEVKEECINESCADKKEEATEAIEESVPAIDDGDAALLRSLQEALKGKSDLEQSVKLLQEKLAVSDTKVNELIEENNRYKKAVARLAAMSKSNKDLNESVTKLEESLQEKDAVIAEQKARIARLIKSRKDSVSESATLTESIEAKSTEVKTLTESLTRAQEEVKTLTEKLSANTQDSEKQISELREGLSKSTQLKEAYKNLANKAVNKYIEIKANMLGLTSRDIKRKLGESYTLEDVDQVCEDLKSYQLNVSRLPFSIDRKVGVRVNEAAPRIVRKPNNNVVDDDEVDDNLIRLANLD